MMMMNKGSILYNRQHWALPIANTKNDLDSRASAIRT